MNHSITLLVKNVDIKSLISIIKDNGGTHTKVDIPQNTQESLFCVEFINETNFYQFQKDWYLFSKKNHDSQFSNNPIKVVPNNLLFIGQSILNSIKQKKHDKKTKKKKFLFF